MNRTRRDQEMVVLLCRELIHERFDFEGVAICLSRLQCSYHGISIYMAFGAEIDASIFASIQKVITLILGVAHSEFVPDVLRLRVNLQREIAAAHGIQQIETNGEFSTEPRIDIVAQQLARM